MGKKSKPEGLYRNLTSYGDAEFSKYMRRAFLASAGYDSEDLDRRRSGLVRPTIPERGWGNLHGRRVLPASLGADLDFLAPEAQPVNSQATAEDF